MEIKKPKFNKDSLKNLFRKPNLNISLKTIFTLTKRELLNYFASPLAYIVLALFVLIVAIIFFGVYQYLQYGTNDLTQMFTAIAFAFIIIIPALTMGSISREKQNGTIEFAMTQPVTEFEFLFGKFFSNSIILVISLVLTLPITLVISYLAPLDIGQILMQYVGAILMGLCFISIGIAVSSFFKSEITALLIAILIAALFVITGSPLLNFFPLQIQSIIERLSLLSHYQSISRGVVDIRDIFYFIGFIISFLSIAYYSLVRGKYPVNHKNILSMRFTLTGVLLIAILIGILGQVIPGRIDFTSNQKFTLSNETKNLINYTLKDPVQIEFFASSNLPVQFQSIKRDVEDILRDYALTSNGKITVQSYDPLTDNAAKESAENAGLQEVVFAINSQDASQRVAGMLGITFKQNENTDFLNINNQVTQDLEYQISRRIKKVGTEDKLDVAFVSNNVNQNLNSTYTIYNSELSQLYDIVDLELTKDNLTIPEDVKAIILAGPSGAFDPEVITALKEFYNNGGSLLLLVDTIQISPQDGTPSANGNSLAGLFVDYGVSVETNLVYDLKQNQIVGGGGGSFSFPVQYPLWFIADATEESLNAIKNVTNVSMLWASEINIDESKLNGNKLYRLFKTTDESNIQTIESINIGIGEEITPKESDSSRTIAVALENDKGGRAVIVGDSDFLGDDIINDLASRQTGLDSLNVSFGVGSVEWATKDNQLSSIKARNRLPTAISIGDSEKAMLLSIGGGFPIILTAIVGGVILYRRRALNKKKYEY